MEMIDAEDEAADREDVSACLHKFVEKINGFVAARRQAAREFDGGGRSQLQDVDERGSID
jgi:hypothetical protein